MLSFQENMSDYRINRPQRILFHCFGGFWYVGEDWYAIKFDLEDIYALYDLDIVNFQFSTIGQEYCHWLKYQKVSLDSLMIFFLPIIIYNIIISSIPFKFFTFSSCCKFDKVLVV